MRSLAILAAVAICFIASACASSRERSVDDELSPSTAGFETIVEDTIQPGNGSPTWFGLYGTDRDTPELPDDYVDRWVAAGWAIRSESGPSTQTYFVRGDTCISFDDFRGNKVPGWNYIRDQHPDSVQDSQGYRSVLRVLVIACGG